MKRRLTQRSSLMLLVVVQERPRTHTCKPGCNESEGPESSTEGSSEPSTVHRLTKKAKPAYKPKVPVTAGEPVPGADKDAGVKPLGSSEHQAPEPPEPSSASREGPGSAFDTTGVHRYHRCGRNRPTHGYGVDNDIDLATTGKTGLVQNVRQNLPIHLAHEEEDAPQLRNPVLAHEDSEEPFKGPSVVDKLNMPLCEENPRSNKNRKNPLLMNRGTGRRILVHTKTPRTANFKSSFSTKPEGSSNCSCHRTSRVLLQPEMWRWICSSTSQRKWQRSFTHK